jgi:hypothetical protein
MNKILISIGFSFLFWGCASSGKNVSPQQIEEKLVTFNMAIQAKDFDGALELITPEERSQLMSSSGDIDPKLLTGMKRLKISTLSQYDISLDELGHLTGILKVVQETAKKFTISDNQRELDLSKITQKPLANQNPVLDSLIKPTNVSNSTSLTPEKEDTSMVAEGFDSPNNIQKSTEDSTSEEDGIGGDTSDGEGSSKSIQEDLEGFE